MEIDFPFEFVVSGTPVSQQSRSGRHKDAWQDLVRQACRVRLPEPHWATEFRLNATLYYLPAETMEGDLDNIIKPILDALSRLLYVDDRQIDRILIERFDPGTEPDLSVSTETLRQACDGERPILYARFEIRAPGGDDEAD